MMLQRVLISWQGFEDGLLPPAGRDRDGKGVYRLPVVVDGLTSRFATIWLLGGVDFLFVSSAVVEPCRCPR